MFSKSSFTSPNDVFLIRDLDALQNEILHSKEPVVFKGHPDRITSFTEASLQGKDLNEGEEFWFKGARGKDVQGWILKPKGWKPGQIKKWPIVLLIHGGLSPGSFTNLQDLLLYVVSGPQSAWDDQWSTRWNPNGQCVDRFRIAVLNSKLPVYAQQGYFTVAINPTGSSGFGQGWRCC